MTSTARCICSILPALSFIHASSSFQFVPPSLPSSLYFQERASCLLGGLLHFSPCRRSGMSVRSCARSSSFLDVPFSPNPRSLLAAVMKQILWKFLCVHSFFQPRASAPPSCLQVAWKNPSRMTCFKCPEDPKCAIIPVKEGTSCGIHKLKSKF